MTDAKSPLPNPYPNWDCSLCGDNDSPHVICDRCRQDLAEDAHAPDEGDPRFWEEAGFSVQEHA